MASEDDEEYIVEKILKYTNSKGWFTLTDATLVTDMREMTITYDGLEIESYKDLEVDEEWENNWKKYIEVIKESMVLKNSAPYSLFIVIIIKKYIML